MPKNCPTCNRPKPEHTVRAGEVIIDESDPRDPFKLLDPAPQPFTPDERAEYLRHCDELMSDGGLERYEATVRALEARLLRANMKLLAAGEVPV